MSSIMRVPIAAVEERPPPRRAQPCPRCGSRGFTVHQRIWKGVKDPHISRVLVDRHRCKRCGWVGRTYPPGIGSGRQSIAQCQLSLLLYSTGLSYGVAQSALASLGCPVSETTVRNNVRAARREAPNYQSLSRLRLDVVGAGQLAGADGSLTLRLGGPSLTDRWLEVDIPPGPRADELRWRLEQSAQWVSEFCDTATIPPESA